MTPLDQDTSSKPLQPVWVKLDNSIDRQPDVLARMGQTIHAEDLAPALRYGPDRNTLETLGQRFIQQAGPIEGKLIFYGASDFHEITEIWVELLKRERPISVIHYDNHTDSFMSGSWPSALIHRLGVKRIIQLGVDGDMRLPDDSPLPSATFTRDISLWREGQVETYPTAQRSSYILGWANITQPSVRIRPWGLVSRCDWKSINTHGIEAIVHDVCDRLPSDDIYITLDTDALRGCDAFTNYYPIKHGHLTLDDLLKSLRIFKQRKRIVAMDVNGDYSKAVGLKPGSFKDRFERTFYRHIQPEWQTDRALMNRNARLNSAVLDLLT